MFVNKTFVNIQNIYNEIVKIMGSFLSARNNRKRTSSNASLDAEVGEDADIRSRKKYER